MSPVLSQHYKTREPSAIRVAGLRFAERKDGVCAINVAIGNVCRVRRVDATGPRG